MSALAALDSTLEGYAVPAPSAPARRSQPRLVLVPTGDAVLSEPQGRLRPTRAGRLLITTTVLLVAMVTAFLGLGGGAAASSAPQRVTVQAGETLSQIAAEHMSGSSITSAVAEIQLANGLSSAHVQAGQTIVIPKG
ncbi:hypothetical protein N802_06990 [Knoellia sinensis KCTC 19936]|uniref:LysM domain-containing protein n=1 Tax=Knoellia sinensis KCTC 19936 TaxID=1385520 RepID=A0A0A0J367_9MICO|nr:LysM peptidoglycan-binding domain-containing protein [Knoellia sinensis]KGN30557.1 hypothetical protein N802_06990 [Knoellia sinensis KCTC 19936]